VLLIGKRLDVTSDLVLIRFVNNIDDVNMLLICCQKVTSYNIITHAEWFELIFLRSNFFALNQFTVTCVIDANVFKCRSPLLYVQ